MEKRFPLISALIFLAGGITTTIIGDINGWFLSQKFPLVIHISSFQFSIGLASVLTLFVLVMMMLSFYLGFLYPIRLLAHVFLRSKAPLPFIFRHAGWLLFPLNLYYAVRMRPAPGRDKDETFEQLYQRKVQSEQEQAQLKQGKEQ